MCAMIYPIIDENCRFAVWTAEHAAVLLFSVLLGLGLIGLAKYRLTDVQKHRVLSAMGWVISGTVISWTGIKLYLGIFNLQEDLPLPLCNAMALLIPVFTATRNPRLFELLYFWVLAGTFQAIITPDLLDSFPHYHFIKYWVVHNGLVLVVLYAAIVYQMRPTIAGIGRAFLYLQPYILFCMGVNYMLGSNYQYLHHKPVNGSLLDYMGEWPYYIVSAQLIAVPMFFLVFLPYVRLKKAPVK